MIDNHMKIRELRSDNFVVNLSNCFDDFRLLKESLVALMTSNSFKLF